MVSCLDFLTNREVNIPNRLAINGFETVLSKRQSKYLKVLEWLDERISVLSMKERDMCLRSRGILKIGELVED